MLLIGGNHPKAASRNIQILMLGNWKTSVTVNILKELETILP